MNTNANFFVDCVIFQVSIEISHVLTRDSKITVGHEHVCTKNFKTRVEHEQVRTDLRLSDSHSMLQHVATRCNGNQSYRAGVKGFSHKVQCFDSVQTAKCL